MNQLQRLASLLCIGKMSRMQARRHSLSPVRRGEGGGEGFLPASVSLQSHALGPSPLPSPRVRGEGVRYLALVFLIAGCQSTAHFTVTNDSITSAPFVGLGAEFNPYLYCRPNWGDVNEQNVADLVRKIIDLAPQHVRIFMLLQWWTPQGDFEIAKGDPRMVQSFIRTVRLAQRAGASVNITLWYGPWANPEDQMRRFVEILG